MTFELEPRCSMPAPGKVVRNSERHLLLWLLLPVCLCASPYLCTCVGVPFCGEGECGRRHDI